ncbi:MAG: AP-4-A phosphorylase [Phycisphaerae bacterium]|nr:AP-4-A phosphorylase [Phycisphaerae bacterium]
MSETQPNLWAPWRMQYIRGTGQPAEGGCFLCAYRDAAGDDRANLVLHRDEHALVLLNRFPYTNGHVLIAPLEHAPSLAALPEATLVRLMALTRDVTAALARAVNAEGFNVGMNLGRCAGAGVPDHVHLHVVPRWSGDTNFMSVIGDTRVIPQSLEQVYGLFCAAWRGGGGGATR